MSVSTSSGSSLQAPDLGADFKTQWANLLRIVGQLQRTVVQPGAVVVTNPNADPTTPTVPVAPTPPDGPSAGLDALTGQPLPGTPPIILQQGVYPVADLVVTPGAYGNDVYADLTWEVSPYSNAVLFNVLWGILQADGTVRYLGEHHVSGNSFRLENLYPNTEYGVQVVASNALGQAVATPPNGYLIFETGNDATIPPSVASNGPITLATGATSVIVTFPPLTALQAIDVANGAGSYEVQLTNDSTWTVVTRDINTAATVVSFNDIYPNTTLAVGQTINASDGPGTSINFSDLSMMPQGEQWTALVDDEYIVFNAASGNTATIAQRNAGTTPLANGPEAHGAGSKVTLKTQTQWYARVAAVDSSGNRSPWANSVGMRSGGVTDAMIAGDISAAHITFGLMQGDRIEVNSLQAAAIKTSQLTASNITLNGGSFIAGNPPGTGLVINSQGVTLYGAGAQTAVFDAAAGVARLTGATINSFNSTNGSVGLSNDAVSVYDASSRRRLAMGLLPNGDYGIESFSPDGTVSSQFLPVVSGYVDATTQISNTTPVYIGAPSVDAYIGPSGDALVTISADVTLPNANTWAYIDFSVDGWVPSHPMLQNTGGGGMSISKTFLLSAWTSVNGRSATYFANGKHTFTFQGLTGGLGTGQVVSFGKLSISVQPI